MFGIPIPFGISPKLIAYALVALIAIGGIGFVYFKINSLNTTVLEQKVVIQSLNEEIKTKDFIISSYEMVVKQKIDDAKTAREVINEISGKWKSAETDKGNLNTELNKLNTSLNNLKSLLSMFKQSQTMELSGDIKESVANYQLQINKLNKDSLRCNEIVTGAKVTTEDKDNTICKEKVK
jgi:predicted RNase H-like nuclease (RuvC/YqgF family)